MEQMKWNPEKLIPAAYQEQYDELLKTLQTVEDEGDLILLAESNWKQCTEAMEKLRQQVFTTSFDSEENEIQFFKYVKPVFQQHLIYWMSIFEIEISSPFGYGKEKSKFLKEQIRLIHGTSRLEMDFCQYMRRHQTDRDSQYFLRDSRKGNISGGAVCIDIDKQFSTGYDFLLARLYAHERLLEFLHAQLSDSKHPISHHTASTNNKLKWTASKAALVELIYALQSTGVYNNGEADLKAIAQQFSQYFKVDLGNYYNIFNEIRLRKKNRTQLLDQLKERVIQKMDELDVR